MINLQVLGRLELFGSDGRLLHSILAQPKRQAVLVYLAVATPRGYHRRDSLIALLWPESDDARARGSLSKAVSHLRQTLGAEALLSRGHAELGLDWHLVWCDAAGFEDALDRGALAEAMALYRGDLLPGFHVDDAAEFDQWLERERARLRSRAVHAAKLLSEREEAGGHLDASIEWARRAASLDVFDESSIRRLIALLDKAGDRAGALRAYDEFAAMLMRELETEPAGETTAAMLGVRDRLPRAPHPTVIRETTAPADDRARPRPHRSRVAMLAAVATAVVVLGAWAIVGRWRDSDAASRHDAVTVLAFAVDGGSAAPKIGERIASLLAERLRRADASAFRGAEHRFTLRGRVTLNGDSMRVTAALVDSAAQNRIARAEAAGNTHDLARVIDDIAWQIITLRPGSNAARVVQRPAELTSSLAALRDYGDGRQHLKAGRFTDATKAFKAAVDADTTFALAFLELSFAANWAGDYAMSDFASQRALAHLDRLPALDQVRVRAWGEYLRGHPIDAERLTRLVLANDIGQGAAWYELGELRFHWGPVLGWTTADAYDAFSQALAINNDAGSLVHLTRLAAAMGRPAAVDSLATRALTMHVDEPQALEVRALRGCATNDRAEVERVSATVANASENVAQSLATTVAVYGVECITAHDMERFLESPRRSSRFRSTAAILRAQIAMAHGRDADAVRALTSAASLVPARALEYRAVIASLPFRSTSAADARSLRDELRSFHDAALIGPDADQIDVNSIYPPRRIYLLAMLSLNASDTAAARDYVRQLEAPAGPNPMDQAYRGAAARLIRAEILRAERRPADALAELGAPTELPDHVLPSVLHYPSAHERYLRAELLRELGKPEAALRWYGTFPDPGGYDLMYCAPVELATASIHEQTGNRPAARDAYRRVLALLSGADTSWAPAIAKARERLAVLR